MIGNRKYKKTFVLLGGAAMLLTALSLIVAGAGFGQQPGSAGVTTVSIKASTPAPRVASAGLARAEELLRMSPPPLADPLQREEPMLEV
jgi:hypothetical protein